MVTRDKWAGFRRETRGLYLLHYGAAFAFCPILYPLPHQLPLRADLPPRRGEASGLPRCA